MGQVDRSVRRIDSARSADRPLTSCGPVPHPAPEASRGWVERRIWWVLAKRGAMLCWATAERSWKPGASTYPRPNLCGLLS